MPVVVCVFCSTHFANDRYTVKTVWNTRRKVRVPGAGKRVFRPRPQSEWVSTEAPHLRVVSDELASAVRRRLEAVKSMFGREGGGLTVGPKRYLFPGLLKCAVCGGSIALVSGKGRHGAHRYGCSVHHQRGHSVCENAALVRRDALEQSLLKGLVASVLRIEVISFSNAVDTAFGFSRGRKCPAPGYTSLAAREANDARSTAASGGLSATPSLAPYRTIEGT